VGGCLMGNRIKAVFRHENITHVLGGWVLRRQINRVLGKDWYRSLTIWGLILWTGADSAVRGVCGAGLVPPEYCTPLLKYVMTAGQILTILSVRRGGK